jgi:hypothetical protein
VAGDIAPYAVRSSIKTKIITWGTFDFLKIFANISLNIFPLLKYYKYIWN